VVSLSELQNLQKQFPNTALQINLGGFGELISNLDLNYSSIPTLDLSEKIIAACQKFIPNLIFSSKANSLFHNIFSTTRGLEPFDYLVKLRSQIDGSEKIEILPQLEKLLINKKLLQEDLLRQIATINTVSFLDDLSAAEKKLFPTNQDLTPDWQLKIKQLFESKLNAVFPKIISFSKQLTHEEINKLLISNLKKNLHSLSLLQFEETEDKNLENSFFEQKKFLLSLHQKKRKAKQIQPPLFQIKKTEEVILPPISIHQNESR